MNLIIELVCTKLLLEHVKIGIYVDSIPQVKYGAKITSKNRKALHGHTRTHNTT